MSRDTALIIAAYNAAATLDRAIASALAAPEAAEVCVVDDGSRDETLALARAWAARDRRVIALSQANAGPGAARNAAIDATSAPWIAILDADDYLLPGRLAALQAHSGAADFVADALIRVPDGASAPASAAGFGAGETLRFEGFVLGNMGALKGPLDLGFLKPLMRRDFIARHQMRYQPELRLGEDYEFYARALGLGARFVIGGEAGYISVERAGSLSKEHSPEDLRRLRDCDDALAALPDLTPADRRALKRHWASVDCRLQWRLLIEAVKRRDAAAALSTFHTPQAAVYLAQRLGEQAWLRGGAWMRQGGRSSQNRAL
ncbi:MAG TPA: glycosyltransferase family 2 protein [Terricaulis sp.]|nr:glycosyltransferase family 2 protein [Terricaulis sp.]